MPPSRQTLRWGPPCSRPASTLAHGLCTSPGGECSLTWMYLGASLSTNSEMGDLPVPHLPVLAPTVTVLLGGVSAALPGCILAPPSRQTLRWGPLCSRPASTRAHCHCTSRECRGAPPEPSRSSSPSRSRRTPGASGHLPCTLRSVITLCPFTLE